ncbi:MAG: cation:proton antiporter [Candidatus Norongarragalinales archaeon]
MAVLVDVGILVLCATVAGVIANRFRVPPVLGLLLIGAIVGPNFLALVSQSETVELFSEIGATLLLFAIGVEFSMSKLAKLGIRVLGIAVAKLAIIFFLSFQLASLLGFSNVGALYIGAILAITSTALMIKIVEQKNYLSRGEVPILIATLIIEDLFAVFALAVFSGLGDGGVSTRTLAYSITVSVLALIAAYVVVMKILGWVLDYFIKYQAAETTTLLALGVGVGFSYFAQLIGLAPSIGAFLAGSMIASLPKGSLLEKSIHPFVLAFSSIFFLSIGMLINFSSVQQNAIVIAILIMANLLFKFAGTYSSTYLFGFSSRQSFFSGLAMLPVGEFSLLIAKQGNAAVGFDLIGFTSATVFFSTLATALWLDKFERLNDLFVKLIPTPARNTAVNASFAFSEAISSIDSAGKTSFGAVRQNSRFWAAGIIALVFGAVARFAPALADVKIVGFTLTQLAMLAAALAFSFGIQKSIVWMAKTQTKSVERFSRVVSLTVFMLILPFIASSFQSGTGQAEIVLLTFAGAIALYVLYSSTRKKEGSKEKGVLFFKK